MTEEKINYVARFESGGQTGPDSWGHWTEAKICTDETKMSELADWYFRLHPTAKKLPEIKITQAD